MKTEPQVIRTKNFVADAANFILETGAQSYWRAERIPDRALGREHAARRFTPGLRRRRMIFRGSKFASPLETSGACRRTIQQSNFRMARENLFAPAAVPEKSIMRMRGEIDPQIAAQEYEDQLDRHRQRSAVNQFISTT